MAAGRYAKPGHAPDCRYYCRGGASGDLLGALGLHGCAGAERARGKRRTAFKPGALSSSSNSRIVEMRHCRHQRKAQARARRIAAGFQAHKAFDHAAAFWAGYAGAAIGDRQIDAVQSDWLMEIATCAAGRRVFDRIVHQIGQRLRDQAAHCLRSSARWLAGKGERYIPLFRQGLVQFDSHRAPPRPDPSGDMAPRAVPASVSAIRSSALKVAISWSVSAMARSISPVSEPAGSTGAPGIAPAGCASG